MSTMKEKINNIHDKFVRESFSDVRRAASFFEQFLPKELVSSLELSTLSLLKESYITNDLGEYFSDLVFEAKLSGNEKQVDIAILFEHKSAPDKNVLIQVGYYMFSHWFNCIRRKEKLKVIIPIIYYQGKKEWELPQLSTLFDRFPENIMDFLPRMHHIFISLNHIKYDQIETIRDAMMAAAIMAQKWRINPVKLVDDFKNIFELFPNEGMDMNFFEMIVVYALNVSDISENELSETLKNIPPNLKQNIMTTYSRLIEKGKIEGKIEEKKKVVLKCFDQGIDQIMICNITDLPENEVNNILKTHGKIN